jgi:hypothetical protein
MTVSRHPNPVHANAQLVRVIVCERDWLHPQLRILQHFSHDQDSSVTGAHHNYGTHIASRGPASLACPSATVTCQKSIEKSRATRSRQPEEEKNERY